MKNTSVLLVYRNKEGQLRTTYIGETDENIVTLLDSKWTDRDKLDELGYHGALKSIGEELDDIVYYDKLLNGKRIPEKQAAWRALVAAVGNGDYNAESEIERVAIFDGVRWVWYACNKKDARFADLANAETPKGRYRVTLDITINALSPNDAKMNVTKIIECGNAVYDCDVVRSDRNVRVSVKDVRELSAPVY